MTHRFRASGTHLVAPDKAWGRIRSTAGLAHLRMHDLRRTFGSWLGDAGFTSKQISSTLGHKTDITSRVYMSLGEGSKRAAVDAVEQLIAGKAAHAEPDRVVVITFQYGTSRTTGAAPESAAYPVAGRTPGYGHIDATVRGSFVWRIRPRRSFNVQVEPVALSANHRYRTHSPGFAAVFIDRPIR